MLCQRKSLTHDRVRAFASCGRSAQHLLLEDGAWTQMDSWFRIAIAGKDFELLKAILDVALTMPTGWKGLQKHSGGLPLSVENLLRQLVHGQLKDWKETELTVLKGLMLELFVKWLKVKKRCWEEPEDKTRLNVALKDSEEKGAMAMIDGRPGWGFLVLGGRVQIVELAEEVNQVDGNGTRDKIARLTEKSGMGIFSDHMLTPPQNNVIRKQKGVLEESIIIEEGMAGVLTDISNVETCEAPDNLNFQETLGVSKKLVRWWGVDGVKMLHEYPKGEYCRAGCRKEKWVSIEFEEEEINFINRDWKLKRICFEETRKFRNVEVNSQERVVQRIREIGVASYQEMDGRDVLGNRCVRGRQER